MSTAPTKQPAGPFAAGRELQEQYQQIKMERALAYLGRCYYYNTPADGRKKIGVMQGLGGNIYIVGYFRDNGVRRAVKSTHLRATNDLARLQANLDAWAKQRGLEVAA